MTHCQVNTSGPFIVSEDVAVYVRGSGGEGQLGMGGKTECPDPSRFIVSG